MTRNGIIKIAHKKGYRVSDCGLFVTYKNRNRKLQSKLHLGKKYYRFGIREGEKVYNILVHRLQAYQKYKGAAFKEGVVIRHKNDISTDNSKRNILLGTQSQNMKDRYRNARRN